MLVRHKRVLALATLRMTRAIESDLKSKNLIEQELAETSKVPPPKPNPFRKRPVNLEYDPMEYSSFYLPSEKAFYFSGKPKVTRFSL